MYLYDLALLVNQLICLFVGHQMMELVEFGMLDIPIVVHEFMFQSLQMLLLVRWLPFYYSVKTLALYC